MRMKRKGYFTFTKHSQNSILVATERHCANAKLKCISENKNSLFKEVKMKIGIKNGLITHPAPDQGEDSVERGYPVQNRKPKLYYGEINRHICFLIFLS